MFRIDQKQTRMGNVFGFGKSLAREIFENQCKLNRAIAKLRRIDDSLKCVELRHEKELREFGRRKNTAMMMEAGSLLLETRNQRTKNNKLRYRLKRIHQRLTNMGSRHEVAICMQDATECIHSANRYQTHREMYTTAVNYGAAHDEMEMQEEFVEEAMEAAFEDLSDEDADETSQVAALVQQVTGVALSSQLWPSAPTHPVCSPIIFEPDQEF